MTKLQLWKNAISDSIDGDNALFNKLFLDLYQSKYKYALSKFITHDSDVVEVYTITMTKFWERFVMLEEELPKTNIEGYIYRMAYNAYYCQIRKSKETPSDLVTQNGQGMSHILRSIEYPAYIEESEENSLKRSNLLRNAIEKLDSICQSIIKANVMGGTKLKELEAELEFDGKYNGLVHKKKRCIKRLTKLIFTEMEAKGITLHQLIHNEN